MKDAHTEKPAQFDPELQRWYRQIKQEQPGPELDDKIIAMAKRATNGASKDNVVKVDHSFWRQYRWPLSSAASVMLVVTVLLINPEVPQDILRDDAMPMMQMSLPADDQGTQVPEESEVKAVAPRSMSVVDNGVRADVSKTESAFEKATEVSTLSLQATSQSSELPNQQGASYRVSERVQELAVLPKEMTQREAVISAKQALNHLTQLVETKQWEEAKKLALKIEKQYPQLKEPSHPQHQVWNELQALLKQQ